MGKDYADLRDLCKVQASDFVNKAELHREAEQARELLDQCWQLLSEETNCSFTIVPEWATRIPGCDWVDAGIISIVYRDDRRNPDHNYYKSYSTFAEMLNLDRATVYRHCKKLREMKVLRQFHRKGPRGACIWHLHPVIICELIGIARKAPKHYKR